MFKQPLRQDSRQLPDLVADNVATETNDGTAERDWLEKALRLRGRQHPRFQCGHRLLCRLDKEVKCFKMDRG